MTTIGDFEKQALIRSMLGPIFNRIKMCMEYPKKNIELAENSDVKGLINLLGE